MEFNYAKMTFYSTLRDLTSLSSTSLQFGTSPINRGRLFLSF